MTRKEGQRGASREAVRACLLLALALPLLPLPADAWTIGGRFGAELDGLGESQQPFTDPVELENPTLTRRTTPGALLELRAEDGVAGPLSVRVTDTARIAGSRSHNSFLSETTWNLASDRMRLEGQWDARGGRDEPAAGSNGSVTGTWDRTSLPLDLRSQLRIGADWSRTSNPDLAGVFDYRTLRGHLALSRDLGSGVEARVLGEYRRRDAFGPGAESYDERSGELEASGEPRDGDRLEATARIEDRRYRENNVGIPSSDVGSISVRYELRASERFRPHLDQTFERQNYRGESGIFQDNQSWKAELGTDILLNRPVHRAVEDTTEEMLAADWRLRIGGTSEIFKASSIDADSASFLPDFDSFGGVLGIAREGGASFWFDLRFDAGRRTYREHLNTLHLVFQGLNLSLASSNYTYFGASFLCEWNPAHWLRADAFLQWDDEVHDTRQDDFRLWIANLSLTYPF